MTWIRPTRDTSSTALPPVHTSLAWLPCHCPPLLCVHVLLLVHTGVYVFFFFFFAVCVSLCVHLFSIGVLSLKIVSLRFTAFDFPPTIWFHASIISTRSKGKQNTCNLHAVISADKSEGFLLFVCLCYFSHQIEMLLWLCILIVTVSDTKEKAGRGEKSMRNEQ